MACRVAKCDVLAPVGLENTDLQTEYLRGRLQFPQGCFGGCGRSRIDKDRYARGARHQFAQNLQPFCHQFGGYKIDARDIAPRPGDAGDETEANGVAADNKDNRDRTGCAFRCEHNIAAFHGNDDAHIVADQFRRKRRQSLALALGPAIFHRKSLAFDMARLFQPLAQCAKRVDVRLGRCQPKKPDDRQCRLLRARCERPCRRATKQRDELAAFDLRTHSMISSASASSVGGMSKPSALAVTMLTTSSNLVGSATGMSAGFSPLRMRPV